MNNFFTEKYEQDSEEEKEIEKRLTQELDFRILEDIQNGGLRSTISH